MKPSENPHKSGMPVREALDVLAQLRDDATVVVTNQGSARVWPLLADHPLDFHYNPSTMGGVVSLGLGLAVARPNLRVIVISGDGGLAMNLGSLITVVASGATNLTVVVLDNGIYEVTGGQRVATRDARVDYVSLALSLGFPSARGFDDTDDWQAAARETLSEVGPRFVALQVERAQSEDMQTVLPSIAERLQQFSVALVSRHPSAEKGTGVF